jgi:hypothetical protein
LGRIDQYLYNGKGDEGMLGWLRKIFRSGTDDGVTIRVYLNPLINTLIGAEKQKKKAPLTEIEVLEILARTPFTEIPASEARKLHKAFDKQMKIPRLDPDNIWSDWQKHRPVD